MKNTYKFFSTLLCFFICQAIYAVSFTNLHSGSWYDPTIWDQGRVPTTLDLVTIAAGTTVTVYGNYTDCDGLTINGTLDVGPTNLTIGGRDLQIDERAVRIASCIINGNLKITGDWSHQFKVYGHVKFNTGSTFEMSAGTVMIDGSGFTEPLSIPADKILLDMTDASSFVSTGGLIVIWSPHFHASGITIKGAKYIHAISFGNNLTLPAFACRNPNDFVISETDKPTFGSVRIAYLPNPNRQNRVVLNNIAPITGNLDLSGGVLVGEGSIKVGGNILIAEAGHLERDLECNGTDNQSITTYSSNNSSIIKGNIIVNNPTKVENNLHLDIQNGTIQLLQGKFDLGDKTVSLASAPTGGSANSYIISHNIYSKTGTLLIKNLSGATTFPVGTESSYLPVKLTAASGDFSVSARPLSIPINNGTYSINTQWDINRVVGSASANVEVQWNIVNENTNFGNYRQNARIHRYDGSSWQPLSSVTAPTTNNSVVTSSGQNIQNFSSFTVLTQEQLIPVTLAHFVGKTEGKNAYLAWETATELNNAGFDIEKSENGKDFITIGFIKGFGNSFEIKNYSFIDNNFEKTAYYRLKQLDFDGKFAYSNIISLQKQNIKETVKVYPNLIAHTSNLTIDVSENTENTVAISIFDTNGKQVYQNDNLKPTILIVSTTNWTNGLYIIRLTHNDGKATIHKVLKTND
ncbi:MAG: T9SS type A sorting domain-containing protein [Saprospiraceae bacterium]|nr:T9SS type A sorting domain-containing protein [Saprospiraceae bacterium]